MTVVDAPVRLGIVTDTSCPVHPDCRGFAMALFNQMASGKYDECATMPLPRSVEAWEAEHRTARKRAWKAQAQGYYARRFHSPSFWEHDINAVNASRTHRQGRRMPEAYLNPQTFSDPESSCELHGVHPYGVFSRDVNLVGYLFMYRACDLALVSQVLGHADHEPNGIMYLLFREALSAEGAIAPGVCVYNRWDSGTDGLRFLKARIGFEPTAVEWLP